MERCASSSTSRKPSKAGAVCGNAARTVLVRGAISNDRPYRDRKAKRIGKTILA
jgi:hypothetical protein